MQLKTQWKSLEVFIRETAYEFDLPLCDEDYMTLSRVYKLIDRLERHNPNQIYICKGKPTSLMFSSLQPRS